MICDNVLIHITASSLSYKQRLITMMLIATLMLLACKPEPRPSDFRIGMARQTIITSFGEPDQRQSLVKSGSGIFGPIETFWSSVPEGATIEIWSYQVSDGMVELYFVNGSAEVQGTGFAPTGAVY